MGKIITWNVNGIRSIPNYHPWCGLTWPTILQDPYFADADIICLQEVKLDRRSINQEIALIPGYDAFYSVPKSKKGYSGVATFCKTEYSPALAQEGFTGRHSPPDVIGPLRASPVPISELNKLDDEGRLLITDHGDFILFNIYFPNAGEDRVRFNFKMSFNAVIEAAVRQALDMNRQIIVIGDVNISHRSIDHCDPDISVKERGLSCYDAAPERQWFESFLNECSLVDVFRHFHPRAEKKFTCWNTYINARPANYGTRIDYILASKDIINRFDACSVDSHIMGSDHCPVSATLNMNPTLLPRNGTSRLCCKYWSEFACPQTKLSGFLVKKPQVQSEISKDTSVQLKRNQAFPASIDNSNVVKSIKLEPAWIPSREGAKSTASKSKIYATKRPTSKSVSQSQLTSFFQLNIPKTGNTSDSFPVHPSALSRDVEVESDVVVVSDDDDEKVVELCPDTCLEPIATAPYFLSLLSQKSSPPCCHHLEPAVERIVRKSGPTLGRHFYHCARSVGPQKKSECPIMDYPFQCDFFAWKKR